MLERGLVSKSSTFIFMSSFNYLSYAVCMCMYSMCILVVTSWSIHCTLIFGKLMHGGSYKLKSSTRNTSRAYRVHTEKRKYDVMALSQLQIELIKSIRDVTPEERRERG